MDFRTFLSHRLSELGIKQSDLAKAAQVTPSYISQILRGKKRPPSPARTDFYDRIEKAVRLQKGTLSALVNAETKMEAAPNTAASPQPLFPDVRAVILKKCDNESAEHVREVFERRSFGVVERIVAKKLLGVAKRAIRNSVEREGWIDELANSTGYSRKELQKATETTLSSDLLSADSAVLALVLDLFIDRWNIDFSTFTVEISTDRKLTPGYEKIFELTETEEQFPGDSQPGFRNFLSHPTLSGDATDSEIDFLRRLKFGRKNPTALFYYRALQNLRDPLHFEQPEDET